MNTDLWGVLAQPPATLRWWRMRRRARRFSRLRELAEAEAWAAILRGS